MPFFRLEVGAQGLNPLIQVLKTDQSDWEIIRQLLFNNFCLNELLFTVDEIYVIFGSLKFFLRGQNYINSLTFLYEQQITFVTVF